MLSRLGTVKGKTKKSKQGVVLVTILFILAIALIFIMSALMLTTATRTRLYTRAEDNQARLTVTSAAESFYQALYMQEITDGQLQKLGGSKIRLVADGVPGMSAADPNNMTWAYITKETDNTIIINFETTIADQTECIQMVLDYTTPPASANNFAHMLNVSNGGNINHLAIGMQVGTAGSQSAWTRKDSSDNTLVFRGQDTNMYTDKGNNYYYSDVISTGSFSPINSQFYGDVVFWGENASFELSVTSGTPIGMNNNSVYFINNKNSITNNYEVVSATNDANGKNEWIKPGSTTDAKGTIVFYSETEKTVYFGIDQNNGQSENLTYIASGVTYSGNGAPGATGTKPKVGTMDGATLDEVNKYKNKNYLETIVKNGHDLLTGSGISAEYSWAKTSDTVPTVDANHSLGTNDLKGNTEKSLPAGTYVLSGVMGSDGSEPVIKLDVSSESYIFYVKSSFMIRGGYFLIEGAGPGSGNVYFILCQGANMVISTGNDDVADATNGSTLAGIVSANCYKSTPAAEGKSAYDYYRNYSNIDDSTVPHAYIYGMGLGGATYQLQFDSNQNAVCTALIGLYPDTATSKDDSPLRVWQDATCTFYGRITCASVSVNGSSTITVPYCPDPANESASKTPTEKYTDYKIYDFQYYTK